VHASLHGSARHVVSFSIFGASLIALYLASTVYHSARDPVRRNRLRIIDHATIYVLIAGTYTPFTLVTLSGPVGWSIFGVVWGLAVAGIILKIFFTGRFHLVSTLMYVLMGWIIIFAIKPLVSSLSSEGLFWLIGGGLAYTIGAVIYSIKKINFNHAAFHLFVVLGSFCHFISVYVYVLPAV
jgi:hemolysin III